MAQAVGLSWQRKKNKALDSVIYVFNYAYAATSYIYPPFFWHIVPDAMKMYKSRWGVRKRKKEITTVQLDAQSWVRYGSVG